MYYCFFEVLQGAIGGKIVVMAIFKCKMCGGTIEFEQGATVGVCDSCGTRQTLPRLDDDRRANMYDRANHFRRSNEFDKAAGIFEQILTEDNTDSEAYWSLVLCRYGIEYVEDPATHKHLPTVNRTQYTSVFDDNNYKAALRYADCYQRELYEKEANAINSIQRDILAISQQENPFDVFLCYKETDKNGRRTQDNVLANEIYHQLKHEGFNVFFSRITLEDKLGTAYEPYIFAALNTAKVMVVLGTRPDYFNAVWVKNEWSRFLSLVKQSNGKKVLIPAYRDMNPYDLPEEFSHLQAQDMSRLGFVQDLIRGIKKIIGNDASAVTVSEKASENTPVLNIIPALKRAFLFLEDGNWERADDFCEQVLNQDPENAKAYLGKLMIDLKVRKPEDLANCERTFDNNGNYQKAVRFDTDVIGPMLVGYNNDINARNEEKHLEEYYSYLVKNMNNAKSPEDFKKVARQFSRIADYKDAATLSQNCKLKAKEILNNRVYKEAAALMGNNDVSSYEEAIELFEKIPGWKDSDSRVSDCRRSIDVINAKEEAGRIKLKRKKERQKKTLTILIPTVLVCALLAILVWTVLIPNYLYTKAQEKYEKSFESASVGDIVRFGGYEQDNNTDNGSEEIEWIVLAKEGNRVLLLSRYAIDCKQYNNNSDNAPWETCTLRRWLNHTFYREAFNAGERKMIQKTDTANNSKSDVFLLTISAANKYLDAESRKCVPTEYAIALGVSTNSNNPEGERLTCNWWLQNHDSFYPDSRAGFVNGNGSIDSYGAYVRVDFYGVRPAMWVEIEP